MLILDPALGRVDISGWLDKDSVKHWKSALFSLVVVNPLASIRADIGWLDERQILVGKVVP